MKTISTWLVGGALAASLTWNWKLGAAGSPLSAGPEPCDARSCALEIDSLPLGLDQRTALEELCARACGESDRLERRADELQRELLVGLSATEVDRAAAEALVEQVSDLRRRSLATCVDGILGVRDVLSPNQVRALLERCEHTDCR